MTNDGLLFVNGTLKGVKTLVRPERVFYPLDFAPTLSMLRLF